MEIVALSGALLALLVFAALALKNTTVGRASTLKNKFGQAGMLRGKSKDEIIAVVGPPRTLSAAPEGKALLQWMETGAAGAYHVPLLFDANGICEGVTHEHDGTR